MNKILIFYWIWSADRSLYNLIVCHLKNNSTSHRAQKILIFLNYFYSTGIFKFQCQIPIYDGTLSRILNFLKKFNIIEVCLCFFSFFFMKYLTLIFTIWNTQADIPVIKLVFWSLVVFTLNWSQTGSERSKCSFSQKMFLKRTPWDQNLPNKKLHQLPKSKNVRTKHQRKLEMNRVNQTKNATTPPSIMTEICKEVPTLFISYKWDPNTFFS